MSRPLIRGLEEVYAWLLGDSSPWNMLLPSDVAVDLSWLVVTDKLLVEKLPLLPFQFHRSTGRLASSKLWNAGQNEQCNDRSSNGLGCGKRQAGEDDRRERRSELHDSRPEVCLVVCMLYVTYACGDVLDQYKQDAAHEAIKKSGWNGMEWMLLYDIKITKVMKTLQAGAEAVSSLRYLHIHCSCPRKWLCLSNSKF